MDNKARYSDEELAAFKVVLEERLKLATEEYELMRKGDVPGLLQLSDEEFFALLNRQKKFVTHLENAMLRIQNKTYGICRVTGKFISKERLRAVPHATLAIQPL